MHKQADESPAFSRPLAVDVVEAGRLCGLSSETIARACRSGELKASRIGRAVRIRPADLDAWLVAKQASPAVAS